MRTRKRLLQVQEVPRIGGWEWDRETDRLRISDEPLHWLDLSHQGTRAGSEPVDDERGRLRGLGEPVLDITGPSVQEEAGRRLASIIEHSPAAIFFKDLDAKITSWNPAAEALYGYTPSEAVGMDVRQLVPSGRLSEFDALQEHISHGKVVPALQTQRLTRDGKVIDVRLTAIPQRDDRDRVVGACVIAREAPDSDGREAAERKELAARIEHFQRTETIGRLATRMAHDFGSLVGAISTSAALLEAELPGRLRDSEHLAAIRAATGQFQGAVRQLLALGRSNAAMPSCCDLNAAACTAERILASALGARIKLNLRLDPNLEPVRADAVALEQVILNLVMNAADSVADGGVVEVETSAISLPNGSGPGRYARLTVRDHGCGMPAEVLARATEPFFTTKNADRGSGLGLASVDGIVKSLEGRLELTSGVGEGTTATVFFPVHEPAP